MSTQTKKGTCFETQVASYIRDRLHIPVERRAKCGTKDKGDIAGFRIGGHDAVLECKNHKSMTLPKWLDEAEAEKVNAEASFGIVVHKRRGCGEKNMGDTYVTMTLDTLLDIAQAVRR